MQWNLVRLRKEKKLNQEDLAKMLKLSVNGYQNKETGKSSFKDYEMFFLSNLFEKPIEEIFLPVNCINNATEKE